MQGCRLVVHLVREVLALRASPRQARYSALRWNRHCDSSTSSRRHLGDRENIGGMARSPATSCP